jgi:malate synthase
LTRRIDELEAEVSALKKKQEELDSRPSKWYNKFMNDCGSLINNTIRNIRIQQHTINIQGKYIWIQV